MSQRDFMRGLFDAHGGDQASVLQAYAQGEREGRITRRRNKDGVSPEVYAAALWNDGVRHGWLETSERAGSNQPAHPKLSQMVQEAGLHWLHDASRPKVRFQADLEHWQNLIVDWSRDSAMPLLIRKGQHRGVHLPHHAGARIIVSCDNSPAHWAFMGALAGKRPDLAEVRAQLESGVLPIAMASIRSTTEYARREGLTSYTGHLNRSAYGTTRQFKDGRAFKLCHIEGVGLNARGEGRDMDMVVLQAHFIKFMDPANMFVIPAAFGGLGECQDFLQVFRDHPSSVHGESGRP